MLRLKGYTLAELLLALLVTALIASLIFVAVGAAARSTRQSVLVSNFSIVSDTINSALDGVLTEAFYLGEGRLINERYSGGEMELVADGGVIKAKITEPTGEWLEALLLDEAYYEFTVSNFTLSYSDGEYFCTYTLETQDFSDTVEHFVFALNK